VVLRRRATPFAEAQGRATQTVAAYAGEEYGKIGVRRFHACFPQEREERKAADMEDLISLATVAVFPFVWASLLWMLGPLDRAAKNRQYPIQFGLADLLSLFVLIQLPIGLIHWALQAEPHRVAVIFDVVLGVINTVLWWFCVRTLSRAGIHVVWQRCLVIIVVMPGAYVGSIVAIVLPFVAGQFFLEQKFAIADWLLLAETILAGILYAFSRFTRAIAAAAKDKDNDIVPQGVCENSREPTAPGEQ
jgi:hypothetical protein